MSIVRHKVFRLKLKGHNEYLRQLFIEAKWYYNWLLSHEDFRVVDTTSNDITVKRGEEFETVRLQKLSSQMKQQLYRQLWDSLKGLSVSKKRGRRVGRLKFKRFLRSIPLSNQTFNISGGRVRLQKLRAPLKVRGLSQLPDSPDIRKADLVWKPSGFYLHVCVRLPEEEAQITGVVGMDMGISDALTFSDGTKVNFSQDQTKLRRLNKALSRKQRGSSNWYKAKHQLEREHERMANRKEDASNKVIRALSRTRVIFQDEMIANWQKGLFGRQVHGSILGRVKAKLQHNSANLMLNRSLPTTQLCPHCGCLNKHSLATRVYTCDCGYSLDRDTHAARNMIVFGQELADVEKGSDVFGVLSGIQNSHLSVKREAAPL